MGRMVCRPIHPRRARGMVMSNDAMREALEVIRDHVTGTDNPLWRTEGHVTVMRRLIFGLCEAALAAPALTSEWAPDRIWLQRGYAEGGGHTWCEDSQDEHEQAEYVRVGAAPAQSEAKPIAWIERWHGSEPQRGFSIYAGRDLIAYVGGDEGMSEAISKIVAAHNKCFDCDGGPCVMNCSDLPNIASDATKGGEANPDAQSEAKPNDDEVICPACTHAFRAIPVQVQKLMLDAGFEPPFVAAPSAAPAQPVTNRDDVERAIAFHHSELLANGPLVAMQKTLSAFSAAPAHHIAADTVEDAELPERWLPINDAPWTDDLIWVRKGDSIDGPKRIDHDDYDKYTHYAPCEPPAILAKRGEA